MSTDVVGLDAWMKDEWVIYAARQRVGTPFTLTLEVAVGRSEFRVRSHPHKTGSLRSYELYCGPQRQRAVDIFNSHHAMDAGQLRPQSEAGA